MSRIFLAVLICAFAACAGSEPRSRTLEVRLIAFNDFHGYLEAPASGFPVADDSAPDGYRRLAAGGAASLATAIRELRRGHPHTVVVAAGDLVGASPLASSLFVDEPTVTVLSEAGLELSAVGNHEFDRGRDELQRLQEGGCGAPPSCEAGTFHGARFHWLAANVFDQATGKPLLPAYEMREYEGIKVAFVGAVLRSTPQVVVASGVKGLQFRDEAASVNALIPEIRAKGAEAIILLVHEGGHLVGRYDDPRCPGFTGPIIDIVRRLDPAVDLIVSGHTHEAYACRIDGRLVTSAASYGRMVTTVDLTIDRSTRDVASANARLVVVEPSVFPPDAAIEHDVEKVAARAAPRARRAVGVVHGELNAVTNAAGQSNLGQFVADAQLDAMRGAGAQVAFMNAGGLRAPLHGHGTGDTVTFGDLYATQPFGNSLVAMTLTGGQILRLLESQWRGAPVVERPRLLAVSAGFEYAWDGSRPAGRRIVPGSVKIDGREVTRAGRYRVVANNFLVDGGDGYAGLRDGTERVGGPLDVEALERYVATRETRASPIAARVRRVDISGR